MRKQLWFVLIMNFVVVLGSVRIGAAALVPKETICHFPPGNPANVQVITVGASAVPAHIKQHNDAVCPVGDSGCCFGGSNPSVCTNFQTDPHSCGGCGTVCPAGDMCVSGTCVSTCAAGSTNCSGTCTNPNTDPNNCGGCGIACAAGDTCAAGTCVPPAVTASCVPTSSLSVLIQGKNVTSYVPKGAWESFTTGVSLVQVEGTGTIPAIIPTPNTVNSCASNSVTAQTVCTANNADVYLISGSTLSSTLTSGGSGVASFSGGSCTNCGVAINATTNKALLALSTSSGPGFQFLDLSGPPTFEPTFASPSGRISEDILINPISNLVLSPSESGTYEIVNVSSSTPTFFENSPAGSQEFDSAAMDCATGIALASDEFTNNVLLADLTQAAFTPGAPAGTWSDPGVNLQSLPDFSSLSAGTSGIAVAPGSHVGIVTGEFGGSAFGAIQLPSTSGSGIPTISDWVACNIPNDPSGAFWSMGLDPHTVTAYVSPNSGDAMGLVTNSPPPSFLAVVDLTELLNTTIVPRLSGTHACEPSTNLVVAGVVSFIPVP